MSKLTPPERLRLVAEQARVSRALAEASLALSRARQRYDELANEYELITKQLRESEQI